MKLTLPTFLRTTTFRLAVVHAVLFILFTLGLLAYLYHSTSAYLRDEAIEELEAELNTLQAAFDMGGMEQLNQNVIERTSVPGMFFYVLEDANDFKITGDFGYIPGDKPEPNTTIPTYFPYERRTHTGELETRHAKGKIRRLENGASLMIVYDLETRNQIFARVMRTIWTALPIGVALSLIGGLIISRWAARRAEALSRTTQEVMSGDLSRRAPVLGSGDEFDRLSEQLNAMLDRLEQLMVMTRHAGDAIAHDLRSPLTRLRNRLEADLAEGSAVVDRETIIEKAIDDVDAVLQTFNSILSLSRIEAGSTNRFETVDITELLKELAELYEPVAEETGLKLEAEIKKGLSLKCDHSLIAQAVSNLLDNAIKYTPENGAIVLRGRMTRRNALEISVTDSGPGIPAGDRARAVQRFVRLEASRTKAGNGLGLSMVAAIAGLHSGDLILEDGPGGSNMPGLRAALIFPTQ